MVLFVTNKKANLFPVTARQNVFRLELVLFLNKSFHLNQLNILDSLFSLCLLLTLTNRKAFARFLGLGCLGVVVFIFFFSRTNHWLAIFISGRTLFLDKRVRTIILLWRRRRCVVFLYVPLFVQLQNRHSQNYNIHTNSLLVYQCVDPALPDD